MPRRMCYEVPRIPLELALSTLLQRKLTLLRPFCAFASTPQAEAAQAHLVGIPVAEINEIAEELKQEERMSQPDDTGAFSPDLNPASNVGTFPTEGSPVDTAAVELADSVGGGLEPVLSAGDPAVQEFPRPLSLPQTAQPLAAPASVEACGREYPCEGDDAASAVPAAEPFQSDDAAVCRDALQHTE
eukprot:8832535-Pyramimonas_sp.AAC.1